MDSWTPANIASMVTAIGAAITALMSPRLVASMLTLFKAYREWRKEVTDAKSAQKALDEELNDKGYKFIIRRQDRQLTEQAKRISTLEAMATERDIYYKGIIDDLSNQHMDCRAENHALLTRIEHLEREIQDMQGE